VNSISHFILSAVLKDPAFANRILRHIRLDYFSGDSSLRLLFTVAMKHYAQFKDAPSIEQTCLALNESKGIKPDSIIEARTLAKDLYQLPAQSQTWLLEQTATWINRERTIFLTSEIRFAVDEGRESQALIDELRKPVTLSADEYIDSSLSPQFVSGIGDYFAKAKMVKFRKQAFNQITGNGSRPGSLNAILAGTGVGKSLAQIDMTGGFLLDGHNVVYFSGELNQPIVKTRMLSNLLRIDIDKIKNNDVATSTLQEEWDGLELGHLVVDSFPTGLGTADGFAERLHIFQDSIGFRPDVIVIDQLTNCVPSGSISADKYARDERYGIVGQEFRRLAEDYAVPLWTATQSNRDGQVGEVELKHMGDSHKITQTEDTVLGMWLDIDDKTKQPKHDIGFIKALKRREGGSDEKFQFIIERNIMTLTDYNDAVRVQQELKRRHANNNN
jgi:hypothetical protein